MYFEQSKKTYYRFPSTKSVAKMDKQMYFPEKPAQAIDDLHCAHPSSSYLPEREENHEFK